MSDEDKQSRTEEPTETKLRDALERGNTPVSRDAAAFAGTLAMLALCTLLLPSAVGRLVPPLVAVIDRAWSIRFESQSDLQMLFASAGLVTATFLAPMLAVIAACGILAAVAQGHIRVTPSRLKPNFGRLSPMAGLKRLVGTNGAIEFAKSLLKIVGLGTLAAFVLRINTYRLVESMHGDPAGLLPVALTVVGRLLAAVAAALAVIVAIDILWTRRRWKADLRMTRHEVKEEHKQAEGDPIVKARLRSIASDRARRRMLASVPRATLVVTNPTHFAVALRYVRAEGGAPTVVAKGQDLLALRIREAAQENGIPIIENKPLARALYDQVPVDRMIPEEFYRAVAEILNVLSRAKPGALAS